MKNLLFTFLFLLTALHGYTQTNLKFCVEVGKEGSCRHPASEFTISSTGGTITFMLKNEKGLGITKVLYKILRLSDDGKENFNNTIEQQVQKNWNYAWEEAVFYDPGTYKVLVYDNTDTGALICTGILKIFTQ